MKKEILFVVAVISFIIGASSVFDAQAQDEPLPTINKIYCAPSVVVICHWKDKKLQCQEFSSYQEIPDEYLTGQ